MVPRKVNKKRGIVISCGYTFALLFPLMRLTLKKISLKQVVPCFFSMATQSIYVLTAQHEMIALVLDRFRLLREREFSVHVGKIQPLV